MQTHTALTYRVEEVEPYIHWLYFFHAWGFQPRFAAAAGVHDCVGCRSGWVASFAKEEQAKATEALRLYDDARQMLRELAPTLRLRCLVRLCNAASDGDDLLLDTLRLPLLRQQHPCRPEMPNLCLSDFVRPLALGGNDTVGLFASSAGEAAEQRYQDDPYKHLLAQTLADRLAEAATEKMHQYVRRTLWGYAPKESSSIPDLLNGKYQGIRPAVGYPSLPDQSVNFLIDRLLDLKQIGITLTEHGAMHPHASVCGLMLAHPQATYFGVGPIDEEQLNDYARRRGMSTAQLRKFLAGNLQAL